MKRVFRLTLGVEMGNTKDLRSPLVSLLIGLVLVATGCAIYDPEDPPATRWDAYYGGIHAFLGHYRFGTEPVPLLQEYRHVLPEKGRALDIAAGEGRNAVYLAGLGLDVDAVDISRVGLKKAEALARQRGVSINTIVADLEDYSLGEEQYDVIIDFYYLQRNLIPRIKRALKPGGVVLFETYTVDFLTMPAGQGFKREYLLEPDELRHMFDELEILHYVEQTGPKKAIAQLVARKPK